MSTFRSWRLAGLIAVTLVLGADPLHAASTTNNEAIVRRYFEGWANKVDLKIADETIAPGLVMHHAQATSQGLDSYKTSMTGFHAVFPDAHFAIEDLIADRDRVLVRWQLTGTQQREFMGRPASNKKVEMTGMSLFRLAEGKIQEIWVQSDRLGFFQQLGVVEIKSSSSAPADK